MKFAIISYLKTNGKWTHPENGVRGWCNATEGDHFYIGTRNIDFSKYDLVMLNYYRDPEMMEYIKWFKSKFETPLFGLTEAPTEFVREDKQIYFVSMPMLDAMCVNKLYSMEYYKKRLNIPVCYVGLPVPVKHIKTIRKAVRSIHNVLLPGPNKSCNSENSWKIFNMINKDNQYVRFPLQELSHPEFWEQASHCYIGIHMDPRETAGRLTTDCACLGIPLISSNKIFAQKHCFPELCIDPLDIETAYNLALKLLKDPFFHKEIVDKAFKQVEYYNLENSKNRLEIALKNYLERKG